MKSCGTIFNVLQLPQPWPPASDLVISTKVVDSTSVQLIIRNDGSLMLGIEPEGCARRVHEFQRVSIIGCGRVLLTYWWEGGNAWMQINRQVLLAGNPTELPVLTVDTKGEEQAPPSLMFPGLDLRAARNDAEALFLGTVIDLDRAVLERDWYRLVRASGSLRQLLLDGHLHRANQRHCISFVFRTNEFTPLPGEEPLAHWMNLDPSEWATTVIESHNLDGFLAARCLVFRGATATVRDVIRACANAKGGVHFKAPKPGAETAVVSFDEISAIAGLPASLVALTGICRVTLNGVMPLVLKINGRP
jgi:hypothetical protein